MSGNMYLQYHIIWYTRIIRLVQFCISLRLILRGTAMLSNTSPSQMTSSRQEIVIIYRSNKIIVIIEISIILINKGNIKCRQDRQDGTTLHIRFYLLNEQLVTFSRLLKRTQLFGIRTWCRIRSWYIYWSLQRTEDEPLTRWWRLSAFCVSVITIAVVALIMIGSRLLYPMIGLRTDAFLLASSRITIVDIVAVMTTVLRRDGKLMRTRGLIWPWMMRQGETRDERELFAQALVCPRYLGEA